MIYNYADVDKFLSKVDFIEMIRAHLKWPWSLTHFIFSSRCYGCGFQIVRGNRPLHFVLTDNNVNNLLRYGLFWCPHCKYFAIYNHFPEDECEYCN